MKPSTGCNQDFLKSLAQEPATTRSVVAGTKTSRCPGTMVDYTHAIPYAQSLLPEGLTHSVEPQVIAQYLRNSFYGCEKKALLPIT